ncbi:MAG: GNAT family N-acetyltransferase [Jatrophihabitans sp.]
MATHPGYPAELRAGPVLLRPPRRRDAVEWSRVRTSNREWLQPWEPTSPSTWQARSSTASWAALLSTLRGAARAGTSIPMVVTYGGRLVGQVNASNVIRGVLRSASVGYWVDAAVAGRGITPTAVALMIDHLLGPVGLHRVEINIRPENANSLRVAEKLGLRREGVHERFLDIDGGWRDHITFAITSEEVTAGPVLARLPVLPPLPG